MAITDALRLINTDISTLVGANLSLLGLLTNVEVATKKNGDEYIKISLMDKDMSLLCQKWDIAGLNMKYLESSIGNPVLLTGKVKPYDRSPNGVSFHVDDIVILEQPNLAELGLTVEDFYNVIKDRDVLASTLTDYMIKIKDTVYGKIAVQAIQDHWSLFCHVAAGKVIHHACVGGLLQHTVEVITLAESIYETAEQFGYTDVCYGLTIAGAAVHDIGKVLELKTELSGASAYSDESTLESHSTIGTNFITEAAIKLGLQNTRECLELRHIIGSHHDRPEWGSLKPVALVEAAIVSHADYLSAIFNATNKPMSLVKAGESYKAFGSTWLKSMGTYNDDINIETERAGTTLTPSDIPVI